MRQFVHIINALPTLVKLILCFFTFPFGPIIWLFCYSAEKGFQLQDRYNAVLEDTTEENVVELMQYFKNTAVNNHPDSWQQLRGLWNVVNRSDKVTTPTKEKFLAMLTAKGLYLSNMKVNDNYQETTV